MLFFLNQDGTVTRNDNDHVFQGQNGVKKIQLLTPVTPASTGIQVAFTLPDGLVTTYFPMAVVGIYSQNENGTNTVFLWEYTLPYNITEVQGDVQVNFKVVMSQTVSKETVIVNETTYSSKFTVEYAVLPTAPSGSESEVEQLINLITLYIANNSNDITALETRVKTAEGNIATNTSDIDKIEDGTTPAGDASKLGGQSPAYYLDYSNFTNKPTIGNGTLTLKLNGDSVGTFGANQTANGEVNIVVSKSTVGLENVDNVKQIPYTEKGIADGVATLDDTGRVPSSQLPASYKNVLEYESSEDFPANGTEGVLYISTESNTIYRWDEPTSQYVLISSGSSEETGNYNELDNKPIINQDLTATGFTPSGSVYYRHTGTTTANFVAGTIYRYVNNAYVRIALVSDITKQAVGLGNVDNVKQYSENNPPPYPVTSVNGKTGAVTMDIGDGVVTIQKNGTAIGTFSANQKGSTIINVSMDKTDVGLGNVDNIKQYSANNPPPYPVTSVNGLTGAVTGLANSNPNLLINSNFAINQRAGYFAPVGAVVYADNGASSTPIGTVGTAIQTTLVSASVRSASGVSVVGSLSYQVEDTSATANIVLRYTPNENSITVHGISRGGESTTIIPINYTYVSSLNTITVSPSVSGNYVSFRATYSLSSTAQTISDTVYFKTSDCTSGYIGSDVYGIDCWRSYGNPLIVLSNGVQMTGNGSRITFWQIVENYNLLWGKDVTISVSIDGIVYTQTGTLPSTAPTINNSNLFSSAYANNFRLRVGFYPTQGNQFRFIIDYNGSDTIVFDWAKLEVGSVVTEYTPPLIAEELQKCQRYFRKVGFEKAYQYFANGFIQSATTAYLMLAYEEMRIAPTIKFYGAFRLNGGTNLSITNLSVSQNTKTSAQIIATISGATKGEAVIFQANNDASACIELDAEI